MLHMQQEQSRMGLLLQYLLQLQLDILRRGTHEMAAKLTAGMYVQPFYDSIIAW